MKKAWDIHNRPDDAKFDEPSAFQRQGTSEEIRRFSMRTGDSISGLIRPPKDGERYFALLKVNEVNFDKPENSRTKILFES